MRRSKDAEQIHREWGVGTPRLAQATCRSRGIASSQYGINGSGRCQLYDADLRERTEIGIESGASGASRKVEKPCYVGRASQDFEFRLRTPLLGWNEYRDTVYRKRKSAGFVR